MLNVKLKAQQSIGTKKVTMEVQVMLFEEDEIHFAYLPSLDLTGYGKTIEEAKQSLKIVLDEFLKYTIHKNTLMKELKRLGWKTHSKAKPIKAPNLSDQILTNERLKEIVDSIPFATESYKLKVPLPA